MIATQKQRVFQTNQPSVVSELIDGEVVIMNLKSGNYYSTRQVGELLWTWIEQGMNPDEMVSRLADTCAGDPQEMAGAVENFIHQLLEQELIVAATADTDATHSLPPAGGTPAAVPLPPFVAPVLEVYADMRDLLLLDPIHDVDEVGWPTVQSARPAPH